MDLLYEIGLRFFYFMALTGSLFDKKARLWVKGRKGLFRRIRNEIDNINSIAWFHCASLGEFEQGRPIIEEFKLKYPHFKLLLTFFSPSGYEIRKNYAGADYIYYLPLDTKRNAGKFVKLINPKVAFFIKYEFWYNFINQLHKNKIPVFLVSGIFRKNQVFFKRYGGWYRKILKKFNFLFVQDMDSYNLIRKIDIKNVTIAGDTRFDRVYLHSKSAIDYPEIELFKQNKIILIAGSTWPVDDELLIKFINESEFDIKYIIAPHVISVSQIQHISEKIKFNTIKYSERGNNDLRNAKVLIIDGIGMLSSLYKYGNIAYIGGAFGKGLHNILEAAAFGLPVIFGPNYNKFREAISLIENGGAFSINDYDEFYNNLNGLLTNQEEINRIGRICKNYVIRNKGVTKRILQIVNDYLS
ncbi:MAG: 3-deoxy-D-manno-octulosonic acid transferase [Bacteroidales bacterium]|nr:3-deoxy-D-manno-octulosonic acid transferase [Bacteroidales bacterium]